MKPNHISALLAVGTTMFFGFAWFFPLGTELHELAQIPGATETNGTPTYFLLSFNENGGTKVTYAIIDDDGILIFKRRQLLELRVLVDNSSTSPTLTVTGSLARRVRTIRCRQEQCPMAGQIIRPNPHQLDAGGD